MYDEEETAPMHDLNPTRWLQGAATLWRDEQGTTLTEFVIILPVFLIIFSGMVRLSSFQHKTVEGQITATRKLWTNALIADETFGTDATDSSTRSRDFLIGGVLDSRPESRQPSGKFDAVDFEAWDERRWSGLASEGYFGEMSAMVDLTQAPSEFTLDTYEDYDDRFGPGPDKFTPGDPIDDLVETDGARRLLRDDQPTSSQVDPAGNPLPAGIEFPFQPSYAGSAITLTGSTNMSFGAGARYGLATSIHQDNFRGISIGAEFDVHMAPRPHQNDNEQIRTTTTTRMTLQQIDLYNTVLGLEKSESLQFDTNY